MINICIWLMVLYYYVLQEYDMNILIQYIIYVVLMVL